MAAPASIATPTCAISTCTCTVATLHRLPRATCPVIWPQSGLSDLQLAGALDADIRVVGGHLQSADTNLQGIDLVDPQGRFRFDGLSGAPRFSTSNPVSGDLRWRSGQLYGLDFGAAVLPIDSGDGELRLRGPVSVPTLGGNLRFDSLVLRPPAGDAGMRMQFGMSLDKLDIGALAKALGWPAFQGHAQRQHSRWRAMPTSAWISTAA